MKIFEDFTSIIRKPATIFVIVLLAAAYISNFFLPPYYVSLMICVLGFVALTAAWNIISGYTGYLFLGSAAFFGLGSYIVPLTADVGLPYLAAIPVAGLICFGVAFLIGIPFLRIRGPYFIIATFALGQLISSTVLYMEVTYARTVGRWVEIQDTNLIFVIMITITFMTVLVVYLIKRSRFGYGLFSIREDEEAAEACGVPTTLYKLLAFGLCGFFMGLAGAASIPRLGYIDNSVVFHVIYSFNPLIMGVLGGAGSVVGGTISAFFLTLLFELFYSHAEPYPFLIFLGVSLCVVVFYVPGGLMQMIDYARARVRKHTKVHRLSASRSLKEQIK